jgi:transposase
VAPIHSQPRISAKQRAVAVAYAREHGIKPAARHFAWAPRTVRAWMRRWEAAGEAGLAPTIPPQRNRRLPDDVLQMIRAARENQWSAPRTRAWLESAHSVRVSTRTIQRVLRDFRAQDERRTQDPVRPANPARPWQHRTEDVQVADRA